MHTLLVREHFQWHILEHFTDGSGVPILDITSDELRGKNEVFKLVNLIGREK